MKRVYCIMKFRSRAWGTSYHGIHEVCLDKKTAKDRCKILNAKSHSCIYEIQSAPVTHADVKAEDLL